MIIMHIPVYLVDKNPLVNHYEIQNSHELLYNYFQGEVGNSICLRAVPEIILGGGGHKHFFVRWGGGGCFVDNVSEGWGVEG